ncbi:precursor of peptidase S8 and S53 subtilisin kexin sedolisin [Mitosporidium daphniae]|uniref:Precursor of peptidase S8 and S53 subtilisin kexin sedolisin n=1 Tax=Mitosporidium daphniae TaxID=1485682 RepID=A0A098VTZ5_9MICR|nr:precursor of peptidase S8 and S53 subtilisin kexin sedolisin [Mitosporidium daphniae]KGG51191.1 precursor of peptidase S8 and S53 subtilisin kexin sedolisin [Mitosporidium daphniae]|eukprot:XP_013237640.1 precursor of peptidase S8 and S53 subtilisin kexin sedolisin [Mitosporidium daphniae]
MQSSPRAKGTSGNTFMQALERRLGVVAAQGASSPPVHVQQNAPWGLSRISQPKRPLNDRCYEYASTGNGVNIYIVDSGVDVRHPEFEDRAKIVFVAPGLMRPDNKAPPPDCSGHGTEVASVAAGRLSGVAKHARILALQVLSCNGQGRNSDLIAALEWIAANYEHPGIVNLSLGGPRSTTLDMVVEAVIARGIPVVVAAGNDGANACEFSPANLPLSMTVGASTQTDERAEFSNYGKCVKIFAPGYRIQVAKARIEHADGASSHGGISTSASASPYVLAMTESDFRSKWGRFDDDKDGNSDGEFDERNSGDFVLSSGTSLAAPAVAGVAALIMERHPEIPIPRLWSLVRAISQKDSIHASTLKGSPNLLLQSPPGINVDLLALDDSANGWDGFRIGNGDSTHGANSLSSLSPFTWSWILISGLMILGLFGMFGILAGARIIKSKKEVITRGRSHYRDDPWITSSAPSRGRALAVY